MKISFKKNCFFVDVERALKATFMYRDNIWFCHQVINLATKLN
jgi:hypothetical protein